MLTHSEVSFPKTQVSDKVENISELCHQNWYDSNNNWIWVNQNEKLATGNDEKDHGLGKANPFDRSMHLLYYGNQQESEKKTAENLQLLNSHHELLVAHFVCHENYPY